ncbi:MAG: hypothetical protein Q7J28_09650 [Caulobacter sp.]|nr:hypothetical protein [Caulobacter sp.]
MTRMVLCICSAALLATACAPLMQAPLVYTSKDQVGINLATTSTEAPGIEISLGYKGVDAAYVPVAVARECPKGQEQLCMEPNWKIELIKGGNTQEFGTPATDDDIARAKERVLSTKTAVDEANRKLTAATGARDATKDLADRLPDLKTQYQAALTASSAAPEDATLKEQASALANQVKAAEAAVARLQAEQAAVGTAQGLKADVERDVRLAEASVASLEASRRSNSTDFKSDAYSVFGSFDATSSVTADGPEIAATEPAAPPPGDGGSTPQTPAKKSASKTPDAGVGLTLGRVFATGIAAQNISGGLGRSASISATSKCLEIGSSIVDLITDPAKKPAVAEKLLAACAASPAATAK